jgi:hypothetical protein
MSKMTIASVRICYYPDDKALESQLSRTHWGFATWFKRRLRPIKALLRGPEAKGVNIVNFMLYEDPRRAWRLGQWGRRINSFEFSNLYDLQSLTFRQPLENIKHLMKYTSDVALLAPWPQVVAVGKALSVPLTSAEEDDLLPYLRWPRADIYKTIGSSDRGSRLR